MTKERRMEIALFRYGVISEFINGTQLDRAERRRLIREKCARKWRIPYSEKTRISRGTINRWIRLYKNSNEDLTSLCPKDRRDQGKSRAMDDDTCQALISLRQKMQTATVEKLIEQMNLRNLVTVGKQLYPSTVYRFLNQHNLMRQKMNKPEDRRKFEAEMPNDLWQSDVMHGPKVESNGKMRKTYLIAIIDDHSRLIVYAGFYLSEALASYLDAFENALLKRGLPRKLYVDNGPAFRSKHLEYITASLNITLIHARPYKPQGKGKIERWFKTVRSAFLPYFNGTSLPELNDALSLWIDGTYHRKKHSATGKPPFEKFTSNMQCLRAVPENLTDHFRNVARRKVAKDRTITLNGKLYEAPVALIGKRVELLYHENDTNHVEVQWNNQSYGIVRSVDLHVNCRVKRDENNIYNVIISTDKSEYKGGDLL